jgi:hypothetical protein
MPKPDINFKGAASVRLSVLVSRDGQPARELPESEPRRSGDLLKFVVNVPREGFLFIANLDASGRVTRYHPQDKPVSQTISKGEHVLPGSIALDEYEGEERVVAFFTEQPLTEVEVESALARAYRASGSAFETLDVKSLPGQVSVVPHRKAGR